LSYFAKPNFIIYDEWFDDNLKKTKTYVKNKKIKNISNMHEFFYEQSSIKVGASENNLQLKIKSNKKELLNKNHLENTLEKDTKLSIKKFLLFKELTKNKIKFNITKKRIYSLSIFGFLFILGFLLFFNSQFQENESNNTNKTIVLEKGFKFSKKNR
tara:strand:- start:23 stop:493 length:471 start_codon:yes stop_codon:yes gene_type:complete